MSSDQPDQDSNDNDKDDDAEAESKENHKGAGQSDRKDGHKRDEQDKGKDKVYAGDNSQGSHCPGRKQSEKGFKGNASSPTEEKSELRNDDVQSSEDDVLYKVDKDPMPKMLTYHEENVDIPEVCISEEDSAPLSPVKGKAPWDGKSDWTLVSHGQKNKMKKEVKVKDPVIATRQSARIQINDNGIPIQRRAELRASKKNGSL